ncbi:hypothetical protein P0082_03120 [Candidatus Haliotispira prima]|uniref:Uncharacterized protein n=1 Tax=Candidatus Haliotispira prima TaxID=3034016 RepID=A0ABY8MJ68_9SPIO|nr:hypothetical protein P0082_03120 [Candidatus Haliotispira prima]
MASQKSFTTAKFATLPVLERRQGTNNVSIHSRDQYFHYNAEITDPKGNTLGIPKTSTEISSPRKIEVKEAEYLILPMRVAFPIFPEPSPVTSSEEVELQLIQAKADKKGTSEIIFTFFQGTETDGPGNTKTVFLERKTRSTNFDVYVSAIISISTSESASKDYFLEDRLNMEYNIHYNGGKYIDTQTIQNV